MVSGNGAVKEETMAMTDFEYDAYLRGQRDYLAGVALVSNPYAKEYSEHRQWARGWKSQEWKMKDAAA